MGLHQVFSHQYQSQFEKYTLLVAAIYLFVFLHLLAVRSGLLGFYVSAFSYLLVLAIRQNSFKFLVTSVVVFSSIGAILYFNMPTLQNKLKYTLYDWHLYKHNSELKNISDGKRFIVYDAALQLIKKNPIIGVGIGDVKIEMNKTYKAHYEALSDIYLDTHNQWLHSWVAAGLIGFIAICCVVFLPFYYSKMYNDTMCISFLVLMCFSFLFESTLETQLGTTIYLSLYVILMQINQRNYATH
jgi:Lipid A core - O-antigen ligase and related enzymes